MRSIRGRDLIDLLMMGAYLPLAWFLPQRLWPALTRALGYLHVALLGRRARHLERLAADHLAVGARDLEIGFRQHCHWELLEILREHAPWGWHPAIQVIGADHIHRALERGRGAVLWFCPFSHADLVFKKGLHEAGIVLSHLSQLTHGFSDTRFGVAVLNPIKTGIEERYLRERCVITERSALPALRRLKRRLKENSVISIAAIEWDQGCVTCPFMGGRLRLARGGPNLSLSTGASLLPLFVVPTAEGYAVQIEPPLRADSADKAEAEEQLATRYAEILGRHVRSYPHLWRGWLGTPSLWRPEVPQDGR